SRSVSCASTASSSVGASASDFEGSGVGVSGDSDGSGVGTSITTWRLELAGLFMIRGIVIAATITMTKRKNTARPPTTHGHTRRFGAVPYGEAGGWYCANCVGGGCAAGGGDGETNVASESGRVSGAKGVPSSRQ